jgi:hypothetical protein
MSQTEKFYFLISFALALCRLQRFSPGGNVLRCYVTGCLWLSPELLLRIEEGQSWRNSLCLPLGRLFLVKLKLDLRSILNAS